MLGLSNDGRNLSAFDFKSRTRVVLAQFPLGYPHWSHNANTPYFRSQGAGATAAVWRVRISDRKLERIIELKDFHMAAGLLGGWMGLAPGDCLLLVRDAGTQDVHALTVQLP